jgi:hypothetical protein
MKSRALLDGFFGELGHHVLAQPFCAAICPRGRGSCPYNGKCFLYVDGDSNSLWDYTRTAITTPQPKITSAVHTSAIPSVTATPIHPTVTSAVHTSAIPSVTTTPFHPTFLSALSTSTIPMVIEIAPSSSLAPAPSGTGFFELLQAHPLLVGIILFVFITGFYKNREFR